MLDVLFAIILYTQYNSSDDGNGNISEKKIRLIYIWPLFSSAFLLLFSVVELKMREKVGVSDGDLYMYFLNF